MTSARGLSPLYRGEWRGLGCGGRPDTRCPSPRPCPHPTSLSPYLTSLCRHTPSLLSHPSSFSSHHHHSPLTYPYSPIPDPHSAPYLTFPSPTPILYYNVYLIYIILFQLYPEYKNINFYTFRRQWYQGQPVGNYLKIVLEYFRNIYWLYTILTHIVLF